ncbi:MAG TPA: phosphoribulokinase, partial [Oceanospirillales bacterium]|nr:phosphoribulokinase [Oceanospirillales bacterium]
MSKKHPIIAVTGSSGAGTTTVKTAFEHIFHRQNISPVVVEGDSFHRYDRKEMKKKVQQAQK